MFGKIKYLFKMQACMDFHATGVERKALLGGIDRFNTIFYIITMLMWSMAKFFNPPIWSLPCRANHCLTNKLGILNFLSFF